MSVCRHTSRIYIDPYDLDGVLNVLGRRVADGESTRDIYLGAHLALNIIRNHEDVRDQSVFMAIFDEVVKENHESQELDAG